MKRFITILIFLFVSFTFYGQNLVLKDKNGKQVNNDTVEIVFYPGQYHGWTEITAEIFIENTSLDTLEVGFRKVQYNPTKEQEYHSFCFAGFCVDSSTYIAPFPAFIPPGVIDSSFSGHFRFDDLLHEPGTYLVSYHFYNIKDSLDTAMVYVIYNTLNQVSIEDGVTNNTRLHVFPNPAIEQITLDYQFPYNAKHCVLIVANMFGQCIYKQHLLHKNEIINIDTKNWVTGMYSIAIIQENRCLMFKKFTIIEK